MMSRPVALAGGVVAAIYAVSIVVAQSSLMAASPAVLGAAVAFDLTATAALAVYWLGVRRGNLGTAVLVPVVLVGAMAARALVGGAVTSALAIAGGVAELGLAVWMIARFGPARRRYRSCRRQGGSIARALDAALGDSAPARLVAGELTILYYAGAGLFRRAAVERMADRDETTWGAALVALGIAMLAEAFGLHLLLRAWSPPAAAIALALHIYTALWMLGDWRALRLTSGISIDGDLLRVDLGLHAWAEVSLDRIAGIEAAGGEGEADELPGYVRATVFGKPNVLVHLSEPATVRRSFGRRSEARVIGLAVGDRSRLIGWVAAATSAHDSARESCGRG